MLNQKTLRKQKTKKNILRDSCLDPPKSEESENQKNLGKTKKQKKQFWGSLEEKGVQPRVSENWFFWCFFLLVSPRFFWFLGFSDFGGSSQESPRIVFFVFLVFPSFFWFFVFSDFGGSSQESTRIVFLVCLFSHGF